MAAQVQITALYDTSITTTSDQKDIAVTLNDNSIVNIKVGQSAVFTVPNAAGIKKVERIA